MLASGSNNVDVTDVHYTLRNIPAGCQLVVEVWHRGANLADALLAQGEVDVTSQVPQALPGADPLAFVPSGLLEMSNKATLVFLAVRTPMPPLVEAPAGPPLPCGVNMATVSKSGFAAVLVGSRDADNNASFLTFRVRMMNVSHVFAEQFCGWNRDYPAAQKIFGAHLGTATVRGVIHKQHGILYKTSGADVVHAVLDSGHALLRLLNYGIAAGFRQYYTYVLTSHELRFCETGAATAKDFFSKHAMHCNASRRVRYAGEFCFQQSPLTGRWRICIDNNSGTYAPPVDLLPQLALALSSNFPDLEVEALGYSDPRLAVYKASCTQPISATVANLNSVAGLTAFAGDFAESSAAFLSSPASFSTRLFLGLPPDAPSIPLDGALSLSVLSARNLPVGPRHLYYALVGTSALAGCDNFLPLEASLIGLEAEGGYVSFGSFQCRVPMRMLGYAVMMGQRELIVRLMSKGDSSSSSSSDIFCGEICLSWPQLLLLGEPSWQWLSHRLASRTCSDRVSGELSLRALYIPSYSAPVASLPPHPNSVFLGDVEKYCVRINRWKKRAFHLNEQALWYYSSAAAPSPSIPLSSIHPHPYVRIDARDPELFRLDLILRGPGQERKIGLALQTLSQLTTWVQLLGGGTPNDIVLAEISDAEFLNDDETDSALESSSSDSSFNISSPRLLTDGERTHHFSVTTFLVPSYCQQCSGFLWGIARQGVRCEVCGFIAHKGCSHLVGPTCPGSTSPF